MPGQLAPLIIEPFDRGSLEANIAAALVLQSTRVSRHLNVGLALPPSRRG